MDTVRPRSFGTLLAAAEVIEAEVEQEEEGMEQDEVDILML